eukprot:snap_masked-scaffold_9-processed-gene-9.22-mRNA-1 protein AED:1.00 eAED:1.00 QI:0/0/0/0/1/1/2/0/64
MYRFLEPKEHTRIITNGYTILRFDQLNSVVRSRIYFWHNKTIEDTGNRLAKQLYRNINGKIRDF